MHEISGNEIHSDLSYMFRSVYIRVYDSHGKRLYQILILLDEKGFCIFVPCLTGLSHFPMCCVCVKRFLVVRQVWGRFNQISYSVFASLYSFSLSLLCAHLHGDKDRSMKNIYVEHSWFFRQTIPIRKF